MSVEDDPHSAEFEQASARLTDGLRSCRAVFEKYRSKLGSDTPAPAATTAANGNAHAAGNDDGPGCGTGSAEGGQASA